MVQFNLVPLAFDSMEETIANGQLEWQSYFINWNRDFFDPALEKAHKSAVTESIDNVKSNRVSSPCRTTRRKSSPTKLRPKAQGKSSFTITDKPCPACDSPLAERSYTKDGKAKKMLICSSGKRDKAHEGVVFFRSKNKWWSPKFGEI